MSNTVGIDLWVCQHKILAGEGVIVTLAKNNIIANIGGGNSDTQLHDHATFHACPEPPSFFK